MADRDPLSDRKTRTVYDDLREAIMLRGPERRGVLRLIDAIERGDREREAEVERLKGALLAVRTEAETIKGLDGWHLTNETFEYVRRAIEDGG